jgi:hypothetical protein
MGDRAERSYRLEPLDASGVFLGLGAVQCALVGGGLALAVTAISAGAPLPVAAIPALAATALCFARAGGHPLWAWLHLSLHWVATRLRGARRWSPPLPLWTCATEPSAPLPPCLDGLEIVGVPWRTGSELGAFHDRRRRTLTAVVPVRGPQFVVEPRPEQERLLAGWGDVLAQFAVERGAVAAMSWSDLARPSGLGEHTAWVATQPGGDPDPGAADSYAELLDLATSTAIAHDTVVTITVARDRLGRRRHGDDPLGRAAVTAVEALLRGLRSAGLTAGDPCTPAGLQRLLRERIDLARPARSADAPRCSGRLADRLALVSRATAGPLSMETAWRHVRIDGTYARTWWVGTWPRLAQPPAWLEPFLSGGGLNRTMTVHLQPEPAHQSRRRIERDLVRLESDATTKEDKGRRVDARHRRATQALLDREDELVAGYCEIAYCGLVTVTAPTLDELEEHGEIVEQLAREAGMDLRLLDARQDAAWAAALPVGLGPSTVLATP